MIKKSSTIVVYSLLVVLSGCVTNPSGKSPFEQVDYEVASCLTPRYTAIISHDGEKEEALKGTEKMDILPVIKQAAVDTGCFTIVETMPPNGITLSYFLEGDIRTQTKAVTPSSVAGKLLMLPFSVVAGGISAIGIDGYRIHLEAHDGKGRLLGRSYGVWRRVLDRDPAKSHRVAMRAFYDLIRKLPAR